MSPRSSRRGSQAVEFALVLPVLVLMIGGIVDYGWYFTQSLTVVAAARDGARAGASLTSTACTVGRDTAKQTMRNDGFNPALTIGSLTSSSTAAVTNQGGNTGFVMTLTVIQPYAPLMLPSNLVPDRYRAVVAFRMEDQANSGACSAS
jgi:Flp pilus assembly protein TadG